MNGRILMQLAVVAQRDADAIYDSYAWPPRAPLTEAEIFEARRLEALSRRLSYRATCKGWGSTGFDELFGGA